MVGSDVRAKLVADFVKRFKYKGPVYEISALTREGCENLIKDIYKHIKAQQVSEQPPEYVDPRFVDQPTE
jgi:GTP-binding protein